MNIIYGLVDPRTNLIRYVGKSCRGLFRPKEHRRRYVEKDTYCNRWIASLLRQKLLYRIVVLEELQSDINQTQLNEREKWWIAYGRLSNWPLTNTTEGGDGSSVGDSNPSRRPEVRQKISESHKNNPKIRAHLEEVWARRRAVHVECGTRLGYSRANLANKKGEPNCGPCAACKRAAADYAQSKRPPLKEKIAPACGTTAAYTVAIKARAKGGPNCGPCEPCRNAKRAYDKARGH